MTLQKKYFFSQICSLLIEKMPLVIFILDQRGRFLFCNSFGKKLKGYKEKEFLKKSYKKFIKKEDIPKCEKAMKELLKGKEISSFEINLKNKEGKFIPLEINGLLIELGQKAKGFLGVAWDISQRKKLEKRLKNLKDFHEKIVQNAPMAIYTINSLGIIDFVNPAMEKLVGSSKEKILGINALKWPPYKKYGLLPYLKRALQGKSFEIEAFPYISGTGGKYTIRHYRGIPLKDEKGKIERILLLVEDVTKRELYKRELERLNRTLEKRIQEKTKEIKEREELFKTATEGNLDGIYILQDNRFVYVNKAFLKIFGYKKKEEVIGRHWQKLTAPEGIKEVLKSKIEERMKGRGKPLIYSFKALKKNGKKFDVEVFSNPSSYQGKPAIVGSLRDISEKKEYEEKLQKKIEELEKFHKLTVGRELKMIELKKEIEELKKKLKKKL